MPSSLSTRCARTCRNRGDRDFSRVARTLTPEHLQFVHLEAEGLPAETLTLVDQMIEEDGLSPSL